MPRHPAGPLLLVAAAVLAASPAPAPAAGGVRGYYREPALRGDVIVFTAEGDLWTVGTAGGVARRLTSHAAQEGAPAVSRDGSLVAFSAAYEGPEEVYVVPLAGGLPRRITWDGERTRVSGWTADGRILYGSRAESTLPDWRLRVVAADGATPPEIVPLAQAFEGTWSGDGRSLFFTRLPPQGSRTRRYRGGTAQNLWRWDGGDAEAVPLTADHPGTSRAPMWWEGRLHFLSDRDGVMNLWSMAPDGTDVKALTRHRDYDALEPSLDDGRIAYRMGADLRLLDLRTGQDRALDVTLASDTDQRREHWLEDPSKYLSSAHLSPEGDRVALTARGRVFTAPRKDGRLVQVTREPGVRYRNARFLRDGKTLLAQSDASGEVEFCLLPANGVGDARAISSDATVFRGAPVPSPDGKRIAYVDQDEVLWVRDLEGGEPRAVVRSQHYNPREFSWSPDGRWLAHVDNTSTFTMRIHVFEVATGTSFAVTSDRVDSYSPAWSPDGKWLYFLSDRNLESTVPGPWGPRQPDPHFDRTTLVYALSLRAEGRFPFLPDDEVFAAAEAARKAKEKREKKGKGDGPADPDGGPGEGEKVAEDAGPAPSPGAEAPADGDDGEEAPPAVEIDREGIAERLHRVPVPPGNYGSLAVLRERLLFVSATRSPKPRRDLQWAPIASREVEVSTLAEEIDSYEVSADGAALLVRTKGKVLIVDADAKGGDALKDAAVDLSGWAFPVAPAEEWRQMFLESWRLQRDFFYDKGMHGVDWPAMRAKYLPLVERVTCREELTDLIGQMLSEVSALHTFVFGGDRREGDDRVDPASLGAVLARDEAAGGWRIERIHRGDPDDVDGRSPLARPDLGISDGDVILAINGVPALPAPHPAALLRNQAGRQVLLRLRKAAGGEPFDRVVVPLAPEAARDLRYAAWEESRRGEVERMGGGRLGYVHLRAMGREDIAAWARQFYPMHDREGLVIDVRHNRGGNIDSWILGKLLRRAWFFWQPRTGKPFWNMQYAFRGHIVVLCNEYTASDGEAFSEGFRRLGLGKVIGTRTWGGEIWLGMEDWLVDRGFATAAEIGVYGPEGEWLIEGHGVEPDVVVDNLPRATFRGEDAQLRAGVDHLLALLKEKPVTVPPAPEHPDKSGK